MEMAITLCTVLTTSHIKQEYESRTNRKKEHGMAEPNEISKHKVVSSLAVMAGRRAEQQISKYTDLSLNEKYFGPWTLLKAHCLLNKVSVSNTHEALNKKSGDIYVYM